MARNRFTLSEVERIEISDGDWIEIKKDLNTGEVKRLESSGLKPPVTDVVTGKLVNPIDWEIYEIDRAVIFLQDWSFRDSSDKPVKISRDSVKALDPATFEEINVAIFEHTVRRATEKKTLKTDRVESSELPK